MQPAWQCPPAAGRRAGVVPAMLTVVDIGPSFRQERKPATFPGEDRRRVERSYLQFAGVGIQFALTILVLTLLGIWLDDQFSTSPLFTVVLLALGFVGATWSLIRTVLAPDQGGAPGRKKQDKKP